MRIPGIKSMQRFSRWLKSRFVSHALILGYHRIAEVDFDPYSLCVSPGHFAEQLEVLRKHANPISLSALAQGLSVGHLPERSVVLTFDDGYSDVLHIAKPLLKRYDVPAIAFIVTGNLGSEFWWDELARILSSSINLPEKLSFKVNGSDFEWIFGSSEFPRMVGSGREIRYRFILSLYDKLLITTPEVRQVALSQLSSWGGKDLIKRPKYRRLNKSEIIQLVADGLVEIGSHSLTHPMLESQPPYQQRIEIRQSKVDLENLLNRKIASFSFPNGSIPEGVRAILEEEGYQQALTSMRDVVDPTCDPYFIPRIWVPDWDGEKFSRWLNLWL
jgi:peptidoglycan/xylan/chitin deacetylase (PgdA/CDA1 family)